MCRIYMPGRDEKSDVIRIVGPNDYVGNAARKIREIGEEMVNFVFLSKDFFGKAKTCKEIIFHLFALYSLNKATNLSLFRASFIPGFAAHSMRLLTSCRPQRRR